MVILGNLPAFMTTTGFIGVVVVVVLAIIGGILWWLHKEGKLSF